METRSHVPNAKYFLSSVNYWFNRSLVTKLLIPSAPQGSFGWVLETFQIQKGKSATQILGLDGNNGVSKLGGAEPKFQMNTYVVRSLSLLYFL